MTKKEALELLNEISQARTQLYRLHEKVLKLAPVLTWQDLALVSEIDAAKRYYEEHGGDIRQARVIVQEYKGTLSRLE